MNYKNHVLVIVNVLSMTTFVASAKLIPVEDAVVQAQTLLDDLSQARTMIIDQIDKNDLASQIATTLYSQSKQAGVEEENIPTIVQQTFDLYVQKKQAQEAPRTTAHPSRPTTPPTPAGPATPSAGLILVNETTLTTMLNNELKKYPEQTFSQNDRDNLLGEITARFICWKDEKVDEKHIRPFVEQAVKNFIPIPPATRPTPAQPTQTRGSQAGPSRPYATHPWHARDKECICPYMQDLIKMYKNKKNLTLVLGAGDQKIDYDRFKDYTFLVGYPSLFLFSQQRLAHHQPPFLVPLDFNTEYFFNFLKEFPESFSQIIPDFSVTKFIEWKQNRIEEIFDALQAGGEFYIDGGFCWGGSMAVISLSNEKRSEPGCPIVIGKDGTVQYDRSRDANVHSNDLFLKCFSIRISGNLKINTDTIERMPTTQAGISTFKFPTNELLRNHVLTIVRNYGFKSEYRREMPYPQHAPWSPHPMAKIDFTQHTYIFAQKPPVATLPKKPGQ